MLKHYQQNITYKLLIKVQFTSTIPETQELITNMVNDFSFSEVTSADDELQVYSVSEHNVSHLQLLTVLENELFLDNMKKEAKFVNFKNNIISDLTKIISEKIKTELKTFKTEMLKQLSESLTWQKNKTNVLKEECKSKDMIIAKLSKVIENLTNKKPEVISQYSNELKSTYQRATSLGHHVRIII